MEKGVVEEAREGVESGMKVEEEALKVIRYKAGKGALVTERKESEGKTLVRLKGSRKAGGKGSGR